MTNTPKKLIEVALPLEAINTQAAREKSIRHGHPSTLHLWWARRPLAAARAVLFAQMVDDPASHPELFPTEEAQNKERERLFELIRELVKWENINSEKLLAEAHQEILKYAPPEGLPPFLDPFAGGGSIPLEAQRLGLEAHASDLNPVAVLINKALIEIPPQFANQPPVHPAAEGQKPMATQQWRGAQGLAEDVRYYGQWMRDEAEKRIGHLYPKVSLPAEYGGGEATVIAWLWARTVPSPNPAANGAHVPLVRSFWLSTKKGKEAWVEPVVDTEKMTYSFEVKTGQGTPPEGTIISRKGGVCLLTGTPMSFEYIRAKAQAGEMGAKLMAIVVEGVKGRVYLPPTIQQEQIAQEAEPHWRPNGQLPLKHRNFQTPIYGMPNLGDLFTNRQLVALTMFSDLVQEAQEKIRADMHQQEVAVEQTAKYAQAIATYLAFALDRLVDRNSAVCSWDSSRDSIRSTFGRQAIPMIWDYVESNPFSDYTGNWTGAVEWVWKVAESLNGAKKGNVVQRNATVSIPLHHIIVSTDPPYYDNISYADLSDFFYVWLRHSLQNNYPELLNLLLVPKTEELIAAPHRFEGNKTEAQRFFEEGLTQAFRQMFKVVHPTYPLTVYYAFKQTETVDVEESETKGEQVASTGWETMLEGLIQAGFQITGTWPMRTELSNRMVGMGTNALASSIVLVCRPRPTAAPHATRREFLNLLRRELPHALRELQKGNIAPVDLAQASIGPGMALFSRYHHILEADGSPMRVRTALALINQALDEYLSEQESEYDADTRWALAWFEQFGFNEGAYGDAETLSTAKNTSVQGLVQAGFLFASGGKVRLLRREELAEGWTPDQDGRLTVWELTQQLLKAHDKKGNQAVAELLAQAGPKGEIARDLAYRLYNLCERKGWAQEALPYNALIVSWAEDIGRLVAETQYRRPAAQGRLI